MSTAVRKTAAHVYKWRVVDIVVASVLGVAVGLLFWFWNGIAVSWGGVLEPMLPGIQGLAYGVWIAGGVLGGLIIRKPGAALYVELVAATVSALIGNFWGLSTLISGFAQGLGAELIFLLFFYRRFTVTVAALAGAASGFGAWFNELFVGSTPNILLSFEFNAIYLVSWLISGGVVGVLCWLLVRALAKTGVLDRFASGREVTREI